MGSLVMQVKTPHPIQGYVPQEMLKGVSSFIVTVFKEHSNHLQTPGEQGTSRIARLREASKGQVPRVTRIKNSCLQAQGHNDDSNSAVLFTRGLAKL